MVKLDSYNVIEQLELRPNKTIYEVFSDVEPDPDITTVNRGEIAKSFELIQSLHWWWFCNGCCEVNGCSEQPKWTHWT